MLRSIPPELGETAPLAILMGAAVGAGLVHLLSGTVGQSSSESLEVLAEHGIAFTILAPSQARRVRPSDPPAGVGARRRSREGLAECSWTPICRAPRAAR